MILIQIDVTLLDKARFKEVTRKNGKVAKFCDLVLFESQSEYGDYIVKQQVTKEERAARVEMPILGNGKNFEKRVFDPKAAPAKSSAAAPVIPPSEGTYGEDDVPF